MFKKATVLILSVSIVAAVAIKTPHRATPPSPPEKRTPATPEGVEFLSGHQEYDEILKTMRDWEGKAPDLLEVGTFGKTTKEKDQYYLRISNEYAPSDKVVLITACIHGNEPLSTSTLMACMGRMVSSYGKDEALTRLIDSRTVYFVPVASPDTYPGSRHVDGVDPNRDFPTLKNPEKRSVPPVMNLREFFLKIRPAGVLSGHTYGRLFLVPWGDTTSANPIASEYERVVSEMSRLSGYGHIRACEMYGRPIFGTEVDWYQRNGAFAMVIELGTHQRRASLDETRKEADMVFPAVVHFIMESAEVEAP